MSRLIDADYVIEKLNEINGTAELDKAFEVIENAPTVENRPQGEWIPIRELVGVTKEGEEMWVTVGFQCSNCSKKKADTAPYCPYCGAIMSEISTGEGSE